MIELLLWILAVSVITLAGSYYAKRFSKPDMLIGLYVAFVVFSNIAAVKLVDYNILGISFFAPAATIIFSITFLLTDIVNEKFGKDETKKMILIAFVSQIAVTFFIWLTLSLTPAPFWKGEESFQAILGFAPRLAIAGWIAFFISENLDASIFDWFKKKTKGKALWMRNAFSTLPSMLIDSIVFVTLAFFGTMPFEQLISLIIGLIVVKWIVGIINIPFMYLNRFVMKK
ncbi:MAG: queuosine precursor transporter [archaeon]